MSWLYIDTRERGFAVLGLLSKESSRLKRLPVPLGGLVAVMQKKFPPDVLQSALGVVVVSGPGPFSSIRTGVLTANLLARILHKPLYAVSGDGDIDTKAIVSKIASGQLKPVKYAEPLYDSEPNITISTKI